MNIAFDKRQIATILAALRTMQQVRGECYGGELPEDIESIRTNGDTLQPLGDDEIDALCEQINAAPSEPNELLEWRKELREEIGGMGFDDPDQAVDGGDAVEYLGKLYDDLGQMVSA